MSTDDQNPGEGGAGEAVEPTEPIAPKEPAPSDDPLDDIKDPTARAEAKKFRAIARRNAKDTEQPPVQEFAKKDEIAKLVTDRAKDLVSEEARELWDELSKIPLGGFDPLDARSIANNMEKRLTLHKASNPSKADNPAKDLATTPQGVKGATGATVPTQAKKDPPNFKVTTHDAKSWYN